MTVTKLRIGVFDIETSPATAYVWQAKTTWIPEHMMITQPFIICWTLVDVAGGAAVADKLTPEEARDHDDSRIVASAIEALQGYSVLLGHNLVNFDLTKLNGRAWINDIDPLGPKQTIDTLKIARKDLGLTHNSLQALLKIKFGDSKTGTSFDWWKKIMEGNLKTKGVYLDRMSRYCSADVVKTRRLYRSLIPYISKLPRLIDATISVCPTCGSGDIIKQGVKRTAAYNRQQYRCNSCGRWCSHKVHDGSNTNNMRVA